MIKARQHIQALIWVLQGGVFALDITLYGVEAPQPVGNFATTVSAGTVLGALPIGVANDGATVYVVTEVQTWQGLNSP